MLDVDGAIRSEVLMIDAVAPVPACPVVARTPYRVVVVANADVEASSDVHNPCGVRPGRLTVSDRACGSGGGAWGVIGVSRPSDGECCRRCDSKAECDYVALAHGLNPLVELLGSPVIQVVHRVPYGSGACVGVSGVWAASCAHGHLWSSIGNETSVAALSALGQSMRLLRYRPCGGPAGLPAHRACVALGQEHECDATGDGCHPVERAGGAALRPGNESARSDGDCLLRHALVRPMSMDICLCRGHLPVLRGRRARARGHLEASASRCPSSDGAAVYRCIKGGPRVAIPTWPSRRSGDASSGRATFV